MDSTRCLVILGFGGHARSIADVALACGFNELLFVDENACAGEQFLQFPVVKSWDTSLILQSQWFAFPGSGDNVRRGRQCDDILSSGFRLATLVAPSASIGVGAELDEGCFVGHHAHIGPMARIGKASIVNTGAVIEHECVVGSFSHVSVNATMAGRSRLGSFSFLGAAATMIDNVEVCDRAIVGAGALVRQSIKEPAVFVGVPAKKLIAGKES